MIFLILLAVTIAIASAIIIIDYRINDPFPEMTKHQRFTKAMEKK